MTDSGVALTPAVSDTSSLPGVSFPKSRLGNQVCYHKEHKGDPYRASWKDRWLKKTGNQPSVDIEKIVYAGLRKKK